ncbi:MAG TPA: nucleotidyltransferase domain-containing protein [Thermoanaerobacter sp.]|nr:nucleotidyltransferase domain-containing protein [Thermoanaerobacter sp.]
MDILPYVSGHREQIKSEDIKRARFYNEAMDKARRIAQELMRTYPGVKIWLFGSLTSDFYELNSDIDLAIKGLREEEYYKALKIAEDIAETISVDLVQVEFASDTLVKRIEQEGVIL